MTVEDRLNSLEEQQASYDREMAIVGARLDDMLLRLRTIETGMERVEAVQAEHTARFDAIDQRFEAVDQRFDAMDRRFDALQAVLSQILERLN